MGQQVQITAKDDHVIDCYRADPSGAPKGGIVVIQEIFGVNAHIRSLCDGFAKDGYIAIAPNLFDRVGKGIELGYGPEDQETGKATRAKLGWDGVKADIKAAEAAIRRDAGKVAIIGYCFGGAVAYVGAVSGDFDAAVSYYGGGIWDLAKDAPKCPIICHIGTEDRGIGPDKVEILRNLQPDIPVYMYEGAGHGFNCDERGSYDEAATKLARERTMEFLGKHIG